MKVVRIKMAKGFEGARPIEPYSAWCLKKGQEYFAVDAGDYWLVQDKGVGMPFTIVIPKVVEVIVPSPPPAQKLVHSATVVPLDHKI